MLIVAALLLAHRSVFEVGPDKVYSRIETAMEAAQAGDEIHIYPSPDHYKGTALYVTKKRLRIVGEPGVKIDGSDFDYSGIGHVPRAIIQVNPGADYVSIENLELYGAHNNSHNGSGVRIQSANYCSVRNCNIHNNDMGIMSSGTPGDPTAASNQWIDHCEIFKNGDFADPGYNHNLYLGGTSVTVQFCNIHDSLTGHNLKSRAHYVRVENCCIHDSSNRELDFVESWDTTRPHSNVLLLGNVIRKSPDAKGNRTVIHFGQEKAERDGRIFLINNDISTPFISPVLELTGSMTSARFFNNVIENAGQAHPVLVGAENGAALTSVAGNTNVLSANYDVGGTHLDSKSVHIDRQVQPTMAQYIDGSGLRQSAKPTHRFDPKSKSWHPTSDRFMGAG